MVRYVAHRIINGLAVVTFVAVAAPPVFAQANTQSAAVEAEKISTVFAFNRICYARVPDIQAIGEMASKLAWRNLEKADLEAFETGGKLDVLDGWDAQLGERVYRVAISQGPVTESQVETFPEFKGGMTSSCTFIVDGLDLPGVVAGDMQTLAGKEPVSQDVPEGELKTTTWAGGNDDVKVFLISKSGDENGGLINVTVLTK